MSNLAINQSICMSILKQVPSQCTLRRVFKRAIFPNGRPRCPACGSTTYWSLKREERWRCKQCHRAYSIKSCSWLYRSKLPLETIWLLLWCWQKKVSVELAVEIVGVSKVTVRLWYQKFRDHVPKERLNIVLEDRVAADEMFTKEHAIMGAKQKGTRNIALWVLAEKDPNKRHAIEFLLQHLRPGTDLATDGGSIYRGIQQYVPVSHSYEVHSKWEFSMTAEIEGVWGCFRTFIRRMYHHVTSKYLPDLAAEFTLRFRRDEVFDSPQSYIAICFHSSPFAL